MEKQRLIYESDENNKLNHWNSMPVRGMPFNRMRIEGEIGDIKENKIYLGEITNTYYGLFDPIDSAEIEEGKFTFTVDCAKKQMLFWDSGPDKEEWYLPRPVI